MKNLTNTQKADKVWCAANAITTEDYTYKKIIYKFDGTGQTGYFGKRDHNGAFTFKMPKGKNPKNIKSLNFPKAEESKISWGDSWNKFDQNINNILLNNTDFIHYASNSVSCSASEISYKKHLFKLMWVSTSSGADLRCNQYVWFNWFYDDGDYYVQIAYNQYAETWGATVGGAMWLNLGNIFEIEMLL